MKNYVFTAALIAAALPAIAQNNTQSAASSAAASSVDREVLHVQVMLDKLGFAPGVLDGKGGQSLVAAIKGFQEARGLTETGKPDEETLGAMQPYRMWEPTKTITLDDSVLAGPFTNPMPKEPAEQATLPGLHYRNRLEALAERYHTTPRTLVALNPGAKLVAGQQLTVPNALPTERDYSAGDQAWQTTMRMLNVDTAVPNGDRIEVDKSDGVLRVLDKEGKLVAQFPATMGSENDPLPLGSWTIKGSAYNPPFHYNPDLFWDADADDEKAKLPPGPNGPVGIVWIDISKPHYGIHGTPEPQTIGRAESHGCIRLSNWDAARLSLMVKSGMKAVFVA